MAEERNLGVARATEVGAEGDSTKAELQRRMEEARESITQTVTEIKDTVVNQYQQVKDNISESLDWREQYRRHTVPFTVGAFAVGALVGYTVMGAFKGGGDGEDYDADDAFDRIEDSFDREIAGSSRSYAAQPVLGRSSASAGAYQRTSRPENNAATESAEVFGRTSDVGGGGDYGEDVGPDTRPSYSSGYQAATAPQAQGLSSSLSSSPSAGFGAQEQGQEEEPKGPGLLERFKETKAYDRLQEELSTLGERFLEELSKTARTVVVPALLGKIKNLVGVDLSTQGGGSQQQARPQQAAGGSQSYASAAGTSAGGGASAQGVNQQGSGLGTQSPGGTEGYGAS